MAYSSRALAALYPAGSVRLSMLLRMAQAQKIRRCRYLLVRFYRGSKTEVHSACAIMAAAMVLGHQPVEGTHLLFEVTQVLEAQGIDLQQPILLIGESREQTLIYEVMRLHDQGSSFVEIAEMLEGIDL